MILLALSLAWIAGIITGLRIEMPLWLISLSLLPALIIAFKPAYWRRVLLLFAALLIFFAAAIYSHTTIPLVDEESLQYYNDAESVIITGMITEDPEQADRSLSFKFAPDTIEIGPAIREVSGLALVRTNIYTKYEYGDVLKIRGKLTTPQDRGSFDFKGYLANREIYSILNYPQIELLERGRGSKILSWIFTCRNALAGTINAALPEPQASVAQGIFLGKTGNIPAELRDSFVRTGTSHILAISGMNLTIIIGILLGLGGWALGKRWAAYVWLSLLIIWFYTVFTGMKPPVIRAACMGSMFLLAELLGRQKTAITAITFTAAVMIGISPAILGDAGFQLSFISMCGLIFIHPRLRLIFIKDNTARPGFNFLKKAAYAIFDAFLVTLSALLATLPVLAYHFGIISILGLPATVFILPALPGIILLTAMMSMAGLFLPPLASAIGWLDWLVISYYIMIVKVFSYLPLASTTVGRIDFWQIGVYYMLLALLLYSVDHRQSIINGLSMLISRVKVLLSTACSRLVKLPLHWILLTLLILNLLAWIAVVNLPDGKLHVTFLDIGQGDSVLIQTTDGRNILIDAGPSPNSLKLQLGKALPFWDKNIAMLILTQPQSDHVNGLSGIIGNYNIGQCLHSPEASDSQAYSMLLQTIEDYNIPHDVISYPQEIWLDTVTRLEVLHPQRDSTPCNYANPECDNLVLRISYKQISFLLTADIHGPTESEIIRQRRSLQSTVLKVAHHGSNSSSTGEFIDVVNPQLAVISAGKNNAYGHPHAKTLEIIGSRIGKENIFLTSQSGNVELITDGKRLWVKTEKIEAPDT